MTAIDTRYAEGTQFLLEDPDFSVVRDSLPTCAYEPVVTSLLAQSLAEPGAVFADIGALYGYFSCWAGRHAPSVPIVAFEPEPAWLQILHRNIARNNVHVEVAAVALTDRDGPVAFHDRTVEPTHAAPFHRNYAQAAVNWLRAPVAVPAAQRITAGYTAPRTTLPEIIARTRQVHLAAKKTGGAQSISHSVPGVTLDHWVAERGSHPTVLKIDVHGAEGLVLRGAREVLRTSARHVVVEIHTPDYLIDSDYDEIFGILAQAGLTLYELRGFRRHRATLVKLDKVGIARFKDLRSWTPEDLYFMRCIYATKQSGITG